MTLELHRVSRSNLLYQEFRNRHYVPNRGQVGRQFHYLIMAAGDVVGIISGASSAYAIGSRNEFFGDGFNRDDVINNSVFRLERNEPNMATRILKIWRFRIAADWGARYGNPPIGFETMVEPPLTGTIYAADNWTMVGLTSGHKKILKAGVFHYEDTVPKLVFCKRAVHEVKRMSPCMPLNEDWRTGIPRAQMTLWEAQG